MFKKAASFTNNRTKGQINLFKMGRDPITGLRLQGSEQLIAQP